MLRAVNLLLVFLVACGGRGTANQSLSLPQETKFTARLPAAAFVDQLDDRERREQMRDWAVLATLAYNGATPEQAAAATYQMPPVRLPYLDELYKFTYGRGRRAYDGDRVLLFVDEDDPDRVATIGRLADQVRMELGEIPRSAVIYVVDDRRNTGALHITRSDIIEGTRLFSPEYGYVTGEASSAAELVAWLSKTDDLSTVRIERGELVLGGRRFAASRTEGVTIDDVAALYQATQRIRDRQAKVKTELTELEAKYQAEFWRRMSAQGYYKGRRYDSFEYPRAQEAQRRINEALEKEREADAVAILRRDHGPSEPGFSLDPHWLPGPDAGHPLMLARLQQLAKDPCAEISRIAALAPKLLRDEPDVSRRSGEAWMASYLAEVMSPAEDSARSSAQKPARSSAQNSPATCGWLRDVVNDKIQPLLAALEAASPKEWEEGFGLYYQFRQDLGSSGERLTREQSQAVHEVRTVLHFYEFETGAQCARYDETGGTAVGMTLFYTDLLAKLWESVDYGHSAPLRAVPGFLTSTRVDVSPAFAEELRRLPSTRIWFGPRTDGLSRKAHESTLDLAFIHRFSRVYAAGSDPAKPGKESTPNEPSRLSIGWWDRHFDDIADHEQQYHRQNQIMKWSAVIAAIHEAGNAPTFLADVHVDRTAQFFPWLAAHRAQLRFQEPVPERRTPYNTECVALLESYPFRTAGTTGNISGGVSLAGRDIMEVASTVDTKLPLGQRIVAAAKAEALPMQKLEGRTVSIANEGAARVRSSSGPMNLNRVVAEFEGKAGAPEITVNSQAGKVATITVKPVEGGVQINVRPDLVEHARAAFDLAERRTVLSFEGSPSQIVRSGDALVEIQHVDRTADASGIAVSRETFGGGLRQARAAEPSEVFKQMDSYDWQVVKPGKSALEPPSVQFRKAPPPADAREIPVRGVDGVTTARVAENGEVYFARPTEPSARAGWHGLSDRIEAEEAFRAPIHETVELSAQIAKQPGLATADQLARSGRLEDAAAAFERAMPATPATIEDRVRLALYDIGTRNPAAAKAEIETLAARGHEVSAETRSLLVDGLRNHGQADVAKLVETRLQGKPVPPELSLVADRGRIKVRYVARQIETVEVTDSPEVLEALDELSPPVKYFDQHLLVGREGFEPDFSGPITRLLHDPGLTVREIKVRPFDVAPGVIEDTAKGQQLLQARDPALEKHQGLPANLQRIYVIEPRRCDHSKPRAEQNCADEH
jgi:hypothetical protein